MCASELLKIWVLIWSENTVCIWTCELRESGGQKYLYKCYSFIPVYKACVAKYHLCMKCKMMVPLFPMSNGGCPSGKRQLIEDQFMLQIIPAQPARISPYFVI